MSAPSTLFPDVAESYSFGGLSLSIVLNCPGPLYGFQCLAQAASFSHPDWLSMTNVKMHLVTAGGSFCGEVK